VNAAVARILLALAGIAAAARAEFTTVTLQCPEQVSYRVVRDLDGDGLPELMLFNDSEVWIWHGGGDAWQSAPNLKIPLGEGAALFDVVDVGGKGAEIVVRTSEAYWAIDRGGERRRLPYESGPGLPRQPANLLWRGCAFDLDGDGKRDFIDVSLDGYRIAFAGGGDPVTLPARLLEVADTDVDVESERLIARYALAEWATGRFDADERVDFAVLTESGLLVYPGGADRRFDPARHELVEFEEARDAELSFVDVSGDGLTDVLAVRGKTGQTTVLVADPERGLVGARRIRLAVPGEVRFSILSDLNNDGRPDLGLPYLPKLKLQDMVRVVTRGEVLIKVPIFLNRGGANCFPLRADKQLTIPIRIRVYTDSAGRIRLSGLVVVEYEGDLDGDGRKDLLITSRADLLVVHRGVPDQIFAEEPDLEIPIPDCAEFDSVKSAAADLDGDGKSDVLLHYRGLGRRPDQVHLLLSGGGKK